MFYVSDSKLQRMTLCFPEKINEELKIQNLEFDVSSIDSRNSQQLRNRNVTRLFGQIILTQTVSLICILDSRICLT